MKELKTGITFASTLRVVCLPFSRDIGFPLELSPILITRYRLRSAGRGTLAQIVCSFGTLAIVNIARLLSPRLLEQDVASWRQIGDGVVVMYHAQEGVVVGVDVRALRTVRFIASVRICWPPSFTTSASMAATLGYWPRRYDGCHP